MKIKIIREDGLGYFGTYLHGGVSIKKPYTLECEEGTGVILLDVEAIFTSDETDLYAEGTPEERKRMMISVLMHEFGHALEEHFNLEVDEGWIDKVAESYRNGA